MSFGQNTQLNTADKVVYIRSPCKLVWSPILPDQGLDAKCDFGKQTTNICKFWTNIHYNVLCHVACRGGYSSSHISFQPAAKHAKWSSRKFVRGEVVNQNFLRILCNEWDERPPGHASDYIGTNGLYNLQNKSSVLVQLKSPPNSVHDWAPYLTARHSRTTRGCSERSLTQQFEIWTRT